MNDAALVALAVGAILGALYALSHIVRIAHKGGDHGTRSRAAAERLDLFSPDVVPRAMQRPDPFTGAVSHPIPEPGQKRDARGITFSDAAVHVDDHTGYPNAKPADHDWPEPSPNDLILALDAERARIRDAKRDPDPDGLSCSGPYCDSAHTLPELERLIDPEC